jgi:hypothetical protein
MKLDKILTIVLIAVIGYAVYQSLNPHTEIVTRTEIVQGVSDTLFVADTIFINDVDTLFSADTVFVDSSGRHNAEAEFDIVQDSVQVSGRVQYIEPDFSFHDLFIKSFHQQITRIDTLRELTRITETKPFYKDHWFWTTIAFFLALISTLF